MSSFRASEQLYFMSKAPLFELDTSEKFEPSVIESSSTSGAGVAVIVDFAKRLIQNNEYTRAKDVLAKLKRQTSLEQFLYYFSWYMVSSEFSIFI